MSEQLRAEERAEVFRADWATLVPVVERILAAHVERVRAEAWQVGHDTACPQGLVCSAHQPLRVEWLERPPS